MKTAFLLALLVAASLTYSASRSSFTGPRAMGTGNSDLANLDDASAMLYNPACLDLFMEHMQLTTNVAFYGSTSLIDLATFAANQAKKLTSKDGIRSLDRKFYNDLYAIDGKWSTLGLVPNAAFMARTLDFTYGASFYWDIPTRVMMESGPLIPKVVLASQVDQVMTFSMAHRFFRMLSVGASVKVVNRYVIDPIVLGYTQTLEFTDKFKGNTSEKLSVLDPYLHHEAGLGLDVGALFHFGAFRFATSIQDFPAYIGGNLISPRLNIGAAYKVLPLMEFKLIDDATATMSITDAFRSANFLTKLNMGSEVRINNFDLRAGIHQGYIVAGGTLHFLFLNFDYMYNVEELGVYSGDMPLKYHFVQIGADIKF